MPINQFHLQGYSHGRGQPGERPVPPFWLSRPWSLSSSSFLLNSRGSNPKVPDPGFMLSLPQFTYPKAWAGCHQALWDVKVEMGDNGQGV